MVLLERVAPDVGQPDATQEIKAQAAHILQTFNLYGTANFAINSSDFTQSINVLPGDEESLIRALRATGIEDDKIRDLRQALKEDKAEAGDSKQVKPGPKVSGWLGNMVMDLGTNAAASGIVELIKSFFS